MHFFGQIRYKRLCNKIMMLLCYSYHFKLAFFLRNCAFHHFIADARCLRLPIVSKIYLKFN